MTEIRHVVLASLVLAVILFIFAISAKRPFNPENMELNPKSEHIGTEIILDGRLMENNLIRKGLNDDWLQKELKKQGYKTAKEIFLGVCYDENQLTLFPMKDGCK